MQGKPNTPVQQAASTPQVAPSVPKQAEPQKPSGRKRPGVLLVGRTQFFVFVEGMQTVLSFPYTQDVIRDLDVVNPEALITGIASFIIKNQIPPANFFMVLSNQTLFSKQITATDPTQKRVDEEKFLGTIPFETPSVRQIPFGTNTYTVVANSDLFKPIIDGFAKQGSETLLVLPEFLFPKEFNLTQGLSLQSADSVLKKASDFKDSSFIKKDLPVEELPQKEAEAIKKKFNVQVSGGKSNKKLVIGGASFMVVGLFVAGFLLYQQQTQVVPSSTTVLEAPTPFPTEVTPPPIDTTVPISGSAELSSPSASVQGDTSSDITITYNAQNRHTAYLLTERLRALGFQKITPQQIVTAATEPQIAFKSTVSPFVEKLVTEAVQKYSGNVLLLKNDAIGDDVVIVLGEKGDD